MTSAQGQPTARDWFNKGVALDNQGKYDDAIKAYDEAIRLDPNDAGAREN
jgi:tetratricopeptide (TPR) repeat protein